MLSLVNQRIISQSQGSDVIRRGSPRDVRTSAGAVSTADVAAARAASRAHAHAHAHLHAAGALLEEGL